MTENGNPMIIFEFRELKTIKVMTVYDQEEIQYNFKKYYVFCVAHFMVHKVLVLYLLSIFFSPFQHQLA